MTRGSLRSEKKSIARARRNQQLKLAPWVGTKRIDRFPIRELVLGRNERPRSNELILERFLLTDCAARQYGEAQRGSRRKTKKTTSVHGVPPSESG